jgi:hypothetical protein
MAVGREPVAQTGELKDGYVSAVSGRDGRLPVAPKGDLYVRDPGAARAEAIRERVAMHKRHGTPIPDHLQMLYDRLPPEGDNEDVELVDAVTGEHVAEVEMLHDGAQPEHVAEVAMAKDVPPDTRPQSHRLFSGKTGNEPVATFESYEPKGMDGPTGKVVDGLIDVEEVPLPEVKAVEPEVKVAEPVSHAGAGTLSTVAEPVKPAAALPPKPAPLPPKPAARRPGRPKKTT